MHSSYRRLAVRWLVHFVIHFCKFYNGIIRIIKLLILMRFMDVLVKKQSEIWGVHCGFCCHILCKKHEISQLSTVSKKKKIKAYLVHYHALNFRGVISKNFNQQAFNHEAK